MSELLPFGRWLRAARTRTFLACQKAAVAVETALLLPIAMAFLACLTILSEGMEVLGKVTLTATTIGNIFAAQTLISPDLANCIVTTASVVMAQWNNSSLLNGVVYELQIDSSGTQGTVKQKWRIGVVYNSVPLGGVVQLPNGGLAPPGTFVILTTINYTFTPVLFTNVGFATMNLTRSVYQPTLNGQI